MSKYPTLTENIIFSYLTHRSNEKKRITFNKGKDYYRHNRIYDIVQNSDYTHFSAKAIGSYGEIWECSLRFKDGKLFSHNCTCPSHAQYGGPCKHQIALMFCLEEERQEEIRKEQKVAKTADPYIVCSECGNRYNGNEYMCPVCGCPTTENKAPISAGKEIKDHIICTECGYKYEKISSFCPKCGCPTSENILIPPVEVKMKRTTPAVSNEKKETPQYTPSNESNKTIYGRTMSTITPNKDEEQNTRGGIDLGCLFWSVVGIIFFIVLAVIVFSD